MTTVSGNFTAVGISDVLRLEESTDIDFFLSGTYSGVFQLERATTPAELAWERIAGPYATDNATIGVRYRTRNNEALRWRCTTYTSGTAAYSLDDNEASLVVTTTSDSTQMLDKLTDLTVQARLTNILLTEGLGLKDERVQLETDIQTEQGL